MNTSTSTESKKIGTATKLPAGATWIILASVLGLGSLVGWAALTEIEQVTRSNGQVIAKSRTQVVQSTDGGVIQKLLVSEGDVVTRGQLLAELEEARAQAGFGDSQAKVAALRITLARLRAEASGQAPVFGPQSKSYDNLVQNQLELYRQRRQALEQEIASLRTSLDLAKDELRMNLPLLQSGDVSRAEVLRLQRQVADIDAQIINRENRYLQEVRTDTAKTQEDLNSQDQALSDRRQILRHTRLLAPASGIVKNIRVNTVGGVLRPGEELLQILPTDSDLILEAKLRPADVAFIRVGLPANIKLDAYDYSIYGSLHGTVSYISADTLTEETRQGESIYYRVQVRIGGPVMQKEYQHRQKIDIQPGMTAVVEIVTGQRSVLSYLTKPVIKTLRESMSER
ncbi:MAG: HlyD family efflux transporter periplasmic adaptor subunit [Burkholderiaceae bacterium]|nr:HlyD family efflux transporter periplasmic adaptor subunit [Burkholderiaceae bacterium]